MGFSEPENDLALREAIKYMSSCQNSENNGVEVGGFDKSFLSLAIVLVCGWYT